MMEYFRKRQKRASTQLTEPPEPSASASASAARAADDQPVLTEEDELFLHRITSEPEGTPPELPPRPQDLAVAGESSGNAGQLVLHHGAMESPLASPSYSSPRQTQPDDATNIPLPQSPGPEDGKGKGKEKRDRWSFLRRSGVTKRKAAAADLQSAADVMRSSNDPQAAPTEEEKEKKELENIMEQLNLAAVNNRVFSLSSESRDLLRKFNLVLQDLVRGVPTAYQDLESLLTNSESQLQKLYLALPVFLQQLVAKLPNKMTSHMPAELLAMAAEKPGLGGASSKGNVKLRVPSVKELIGKRGAIAALLRAITDFLRTRFPAVLGVNVLWSLALFVLLLVFWYCHKRGKEVRLEKERALTEAEMEDIRKQVEADPAADYVPPTTTLAPPGADIDEVRRGAAEARAARAAAAEGGSLESSLYAENGSLAQELRKEEDAARKGTSQADETAKGTKSDKPGSGLLGEGSHANISNHSERAMRNYDQSEAEQRIDLDIGEGTSELTEKTKRKERRLAEAPSTQPLDRQESCRVM